MPETEVNGVRLHYETYGDGDPILCVHGGGSSAVMWAEAFGELARLGRVVAYDRRGCGRSERPEPYVTTVAEQAEDAATLLRALDSRPAVVIARSYGGAVALELALRHPESVAALALLEADALGLSPAAVEWTRGVRERLLDVESRDGVEAVYEALVEEVMGPGVWGTFPAEVQALLAANGPALVAELGYVDEIHPDAGAIGKVTVPALVVAATDSPAPQRAMSDALAATLPNARTATVAGGHLIDPAAPEVLAFVRDVTRRSG